MNFGFNNTGSCSLPFMVELSESLERAHGLAVGPDDVYCQFLEQLPGGSLQLLLVLFINIWTGGSLSSFLFWDLGGVAWSLEVADRGGIWKVGLHFLE